MQTESFESWKRKVNKAIDSIVGLTGDDLPDVDYRGCYDSGDTPMDAANYALAEAGFDAESDVAYD